MAGKSDTWMPLYIADYLRKTMHLTRDQHGAYLLLLMACWDRGGRLPNDAGQLAGIARATAGEWKRLAPIILPFFKSDGAHLVQDRVIEEHEKATRLSEARREAGKQGGRPRKESKDGSQQKPKAFANGNQIGSQNETPAGVRSLPPPLTEEPPLPPEGDGELFGGEGDRPAKPDEVQAAFDLWNDVAKRCGLPVAKFLDDSRRRAIRKRLEAGGLEMWKAALGAVEASAFLRGQRPGKDDRVFRADLTFVCQAKSFQKLVDGAYGIDALPEVPPADTPPDPWPSRIREYRKNAYWNRLDWGPPPGKPGCTLSPETLIANGYVPTAQTQSAA
jgi:uncharacterized protein YdaU (DUF1376 family)